MKKFFIRLFRFLCWITVAGYLVCSLSASLRPSRFFFSDALGLAYPIALIALVLVIAVTAFVNRKIALIALVCLFIGFNNLSRSFAFHPFTAHQREQYADTGSLRVLTWNVYFFQNDHWRKNDTAGLPRRQMIEAIRRLNPDVLCFQEYLSYNHTNWNVCMNEILAGMGYKYQVFSNDKRYEVSGGDSQLGTIIMSRLPVTDSIRIPLNNHEKEYLVGIDVLFQQKKVRVFTTHLASLGLYTDTAHTGLGSENIYELTYSRKRTVARKLKNTGIEHETESDIISQALRSSPYPTVFCADMNSSPCTYAYRTIRGDANDAFIKKGFGFGQTYDALSPTLRIDMCFADKRLAVTDCFVEKLHGLSDHFPVTSTFRWAK